MILRVPILVLSGVLATLMPAAASSTSAAATLCHDSRLEPPLRVEACARALAAPELSEQQQLALLAARAQALDDLGDYASSIQDYDSAIILSPRDPVLRLNRGVARMHSGRPADAIEDYDEAARLKPDWHLPYFDRAVALSDLGQRAAALQDYERAIRLKPDDAWIYVGQGDVLAASGEPARALEAYANAIRLRPDLDDPRAKRAELLLRLDRPAEALPELDRVLAVDPSKPRLWQARGKTRFELARYGEAEADFSRAFDLAPDEEARRDLARAQLGAGDPQAAWRTLSPALGTSGAADDLTLGAMVALLTNRAAEDLVRKAIDLKPGDGTARAILALVLWRQGKADTARDAARLAVTFAPGDAEIAAVARLAGAPPGPEAVQPAPAMPKATPAKAALATCIADLEAGDLPAARAANAAWSLCHLAAVMGQ
ncbi:MAG TPA: tetratricopeptide repeat protein [Dongiaceae bacterium]|nr:tetratricopeptide repeat protein [Dongiaceae bacterium]